MVTKDLAVSHIGAPHEYTRQNDCKSFSIAIVNDEKRDQNLVLDMNGLGIAVDGGEGDEGEAA